MNHTNHRSFDPGRCREAMEMFAKMQKDAPPPPTLYVTLAATLESLKQATEAASDSYRNPAMSLRFTGVPIEGYETLEECKARAITAPPGKRVEYITQIGATVPVGPTLGGHAMDIRGDHMVDQWNGTPWNPVRYKLQAKPDPTPPSQNPDTTPE